MNPVRTYLKNKKGINTILAALLMVVIVVVASVMVYAWSTGLLGALMGGTNQNVGKDAITMDSFAWACPTSTCTNVTLSLRNAGTASVSFQAYYVKDNSGNSWQLQTWAPSGQPISPGNVLAVNIAIGTTACPSCQYTGTQGAFNTFTAGGYTVQVVTTRNTPFPFTVTR